MAESEDNLFAAAMTNCDAKRGPMLMDYGTTANMCVVRGQVSGARALFTPHQMCCPRTPSLVLLCCCVQTCSVANVGDSRCIILERKVALPTTADDGKAAAAGKKRPAAAPRSAKARAAAAGGTATTAAAAEPNGGWRLAFASVDHNPTVNVAERQRVRVAGGSCETIGGEIRIHPGSLSFVAAREQKLSINMSRAMGHTTLSRYGVTPTPDITHVPLKAAHEYLICSASDGVFDVLTNDQVTALLVATAATAATANTPSATATATATAASPAGALASASVLHRMCRRVMADSFTVWRRFGPPAGDNITLVIAHLTPNTAATATATASSSASAKA